MRKLKKPKVVVIDRSKWVRGRKFGRSRLRQVADDLPPGCKTIRQCCLGFYCRAAELKVSDITGAVSPSCLRVRIPELVADDGYNKAICSELIECNDRPVAKYFTEEMREEQLKELAEGLGVKFVFKN